MPKYDLRTTSMAAYDAALRRAQRAIRRGHKEDAAYWMKVADHAERIGSRASVTREKRARDLAALTKRNQRTEEQPYSAWRR